MNEKSVAGGVSPDTADTPAAEGQALSGFKIRRSVNSRITDVELTEQELYDAYLYKEELFYREDIRNTLREAENDGALGGLTADALISDEELFEHMVSEYVRNRDKYGMDWYEAARYAIFDCLPGAQSV